VRQYRHGVGDYLWESPAGKLDPGEAPAACAVRELQEEAGVSAARWTPLGTYLPAPGIFTEIIHLYLAQDLTLGAAKPDEDEDLELAWLPIAEVGERIVSGEWNDGKTGFALWRALHRLQL
jgi:8-oxo-dGTP pyrophosphatase MutT (NUDIX family)